MPSQSRSKTAAAYGKEETVSGRWSLIMTSKSPDSGDGIRSTRTTGVFRALNFELFVKPVRSQFVATQLNLRIVELLKLITLATPPPKRAPFLDLCLNLSAFNMVIGSKNWRLGRPGNEARYWFGNQILYNFFNLLVGFPFRFVNKKQGDPPQLDLILQLIKDHIKMVVGYFTF